MPSARGRSSPLSILGFSADDEDFYRVLLRHSGASLDDLAGTAGLSAHAMRQELSRFVALGLVSVEEGTIVAESPDHAVGRLISDEAMRLQNANEQLAALRGLLPSLVGDHLASQTPKGESVDAEMVEGNVVSLIRSLSASSTGDLLWLRPDQWRVYAAAEIDDWVKDLVRSGRRSRAIYPARVLEEAPDMVRSRAEAGESVRILASVPSRVAILGSQSAVLPDRWGVNTGRRLVIREPAVIGALTALFESMWERAMAVPGLDGRHDGSDRVNDRHLLLDQLAGGAKDEQIARALGISLRTVRRRVADVLDELGVESRFQAGVEAVRRGWV